MSAKSFENLKNAILQAGLKGPCGCLPVVVWFVDRLHDYMRVLNEAHGTVGHEYRPKQVAPRLYEVPLFTFNPQGATEAELACRPKFCSTPGIWLEMNDGSHQQLDKEVSDEPKCP